MVGKVTAIIEFEALLHVFGMRQQCLSFRDTSGGSLRACVFGIILQLGPCEYFVNKSPYRVMGPKTFPEIAMYGACGRNNWGRAATTIIKLEGTILVAGWRP